MKIKQHSKIIICLTIVILMSLLCSCAKTNNSKNDQAGGDSMESITQNNTRSETNDIASTATGATTIYLGGMSPTDALEYMKATPDLVIVEVNTAEWKKPTPFKNAMWIPHDEMAKRYNEIPTGRPVLLHCGAGIVSVYAYEILQERRKDIPKLSYIKGAPPISEYNEWYQKNNK